MLTFATFAQNNRARGSKAHLRAVQLAALALVSFHAANADRLDTTAWNFQLADGGGGSSAVLNLTTSIEIYCNDFNHAITDPHKNYGATVSGITAWTFKAGSTRFGTMNKPSDWTIVTINDGDANDKTDSATINLAGGLARYQMAAYLVSQYNRAAGNNNFNNGIQMAIWEILDPEAYTLKSQTPLALNPHVSAQYLNDALEMAAEWYQKTTALQRDTYLAGFRIVSDSTMTSGGTDAPRIGGFQEQIMRLPEPGSYSLLTMGLIGIGFARRRGTRRKSVIASASSEAA